MGALEKLLKAVRLDGGSEDGMEDFDEEYYDDEEFDEEELDDGFYEEKSKKFESKFQSVKGEKKQSEKKKEDSPKNQKEKSASAATKSKGEKSNSQKSQAKTLSKAASQKITSINAGRRYTEGGSENMEVCVIRVSSMDDAREAAEALRDGCVVILNLEGVDIELSQRVIDFVSGACYTLEGKLTKVSAYLFVLGTEDTKITGDFQDIQNMLRNASLNINGESIYH